MQHQRATLPECAVHAAAHIHTNSHMCFSGCQRVVCDSNVQHAPTHTHTHWSDAPRRHRRSLITTATHRIASCRPSPDGRQKFKFPPPPTIIRLPTRETVGRPDWWVGIRDASRFYALGRRVLPRDFQPVGGCKSRWHCETMRWVRA